MQKPAPFHLKMNPVISLFIALNLTLVGTLSAQVTRVGGIARDFTVTNRATGKPLRLSDFAGKILVLDFFAYWCGPCQVSSPDVEANIQKYYAARGGNPYGVPVQVLAVNIEPANSQLTDEFIKNAGLGLVADDPMTSAGAWSQFDEENAIPLFAIINCVAQSPSHAQWLLMYKRAGYAGATTLRGYIDQVKKGAENSPEIAVEQPTGNNLTDNSGQVAFGSQNPGTTGSAKTFTIRNSGNANLAGIAVTKAGSHAADFSVNTSGMAGSLAPGASTTFTVTFTPGTAGARNATLKIASNDADENPFDISLSGSGTIPPAPEIAIEQSGGLNLSDGSGVVNCGNPYVGTAAAAKTFTIRNIGIADLSGIAINKAGGNPDDFLVSGPATNTLAPGGSTTFTVTFKPTAAGARNTTLQIASNDADENPFDVRLSGVAIYDSFRIALTDPFFAPRVGNQLTLDLKRLANAGETIKLVGKLPTGLKFNATTGLLTGVLSDKAGTYPLTVQFLQGKAVVRTVSLPLTIQPYPATLLGSFEGLLEDGAGIPTGAVRFAITKPGAWSATLESAGASRRSAKGSFLLNQQTDTITLTANFAASETVPAESVTVTLDADSPLFAGSHAGGTLRGFRISQGMELPASGAICNLALDQGEQDGIAAPAGIGSLSGKFGETGSATFKGLLGDATTASVSLRISATGQVLVWTQPYLNKQSFLGGIVTLPNLGQSPANNEPLEPGLWWFKAADAKTLAYPSGFGPLQVEALGAAWTPPASAITLGSALGWADGRTANLLIEGAGLSNAEPQVTAPALPTALTLDDKFNLYATAPQGVILVPWLGKVAKADGKWTGTLTLPGGFAPEVLAGTAAASGVLLPGADVSGCGLIKVPVAGPKGSFRTATAILDD